MLYIKKTEELFSRICHSSDIFSKVTFFPSSGEQGWEQDVLQIEEAKPSYVKTNFKKKEEKKEGRKGGR